jgi:hypothetical protein
LGNSSDAPAWGADTGPPSWAPAVGSRGALTDEPLSVAVFDRDALRAAILEEGLRDVLQDRGNLGALI